MGNKAGYATAILAAMGLRPGQGAERFLWCEPDPGCRALLTAYTDPALMREAAAIIRGWKDEEPRALWERLRAEGPIREATGAEVARWAVGTQWGQPGREVWAAYCDIKAEGRDFVDRHGVAGHWVAQTAVKVSDRLAHAPLIAGETTTGAVDPREVARYILTGTWAYRKGHAESGFNPAAVSARPATATDHGSNGRTVDLEAEVVERGTLDTWGPARVEPAAVEPLNIPGGTVVYVDPPYAGTTGYGSDLPRAEVVRLARLWSEAGALVVISEAEPVEALQDWHAVEITSERRGQKRTFSKQQREWLTMNREPAVRPMVQAQLFGDAA